MEMKPVLKVIGGILPVLYCGGLVYYFFFDVSGGSAQTAREIGLGPTVIGLGVVGLLFCIPLIVRIVLLFAGPRSPGSGGRSDPGDPPDDSGSGARMDAAIARYLAQQSAEPVAGSPLPPASGGGPAKPAGFGRRIR